MKHSVSILILLALCLNCFGQEDEHMDRKALRDSLSQASNVLAYHPDSLDLRLRKAKWNILLEEWQYAREEYDYVLNPQPDNVAALFYRAFVNEKQHRYKFARLDLEHLLYVVPGNFEATLGLALLNQKDNRHTEAMNMINLLVEQHPANALAYAARAGMEVEQKLYAPAEYDYGKAIELSADNTDYLLSRADVRLRMKDKKGAREDLDRMVSLGISRASLSAWYAKCK